MTITNIFDEITKITLMCPKCFHKEEFEVSIKILDKKKLKLNVDSFNYKCPKCGFTMVDVDEAIIDDIITLNKEGYATKFCCSGHEDGSNLYVYFKDKKLYKDMKKFGVKVPEYLKVEIEVTSDQYKFIIRGNRDTLFASENMSRADYLSKALSDFHELIWEVLYRKDVLDAVYPKAVRKRMNRAIYKMNKKLSEQEDDK